MTPVRLPDPWSLFEAALWPLQQAQVHCAALLAPQLSAEAIALQQMMRGIHF